MKLKFDRYLHPRLALRANKNKKLRKNLRRNIRVDKRRPLNPAKSAFLRIKGSDLLATSVATSANNLSSASPTSGQLFVPAYLGRRAS